MTWKQPRIFNHLATTVILRTAKPAPSGRLKVKLQRLSSSYGFWPQEPQSSSKSAFRKVTNSTVGELSNKVFNGKFHVKHLLKNTSWIEQQTINLVNQLKKPQLPAEKTLQLKTKLNLENPRQNRDALTKTNPEEKLTAENHTTNKYGRKLDVADN